MNQFLNGLAKEANGKLTENGQYSLKSTRNAMIDLFGEIGALRFRDPKDIESLFASAYAEDRLHAVKTLFYARDIREGLGERNVFRVIAKHLAHNHKEDIKINFPIIAEFGRWDDFYCFVGTPLEKEAFEFMHEQYMKDLEALAKGNGESVSLLGKWLKSVNASSVETRKLGRLTAKYFGESQADYRKNCSKLRAHIDIVESKMSANSWTEINYSAVPSVASLRYRDAFVKHDEEGYKSFLESVAKGEKTINAGALFPYDLVGNYMGWGKNSQMDPTVEAQWKAMPNFVTEPKDFLIMADVSGSMMGRPMETSVGLAIYFAEKNTGMYHNKFMTFSGKPELIDLPEGGTLYEKVQKTMHANWGMNTDLRAAFEMILKAAVKNNVAQEELPAALVVISDMEIDAGCNDELTFVDEMEAKFKAAGYKIPVLVWWNVEARQDTFHAEATNPNVRFVSGSSASVFKGLIEKMGYTALELMYGVLDAERYAAVKVA